MTQITNRYGIYEVDHTKFGGKVDIEDFNTNFPNKKRISNQIKDVKESNQRKEQKKYKHMTLEELREMPREMLRGQEGRCRLGLKGS